MLNENFQFRIKIDSVMAGMRIDNFLSQYIEQKKAAFRGLPIIFSRTRIQKFIQEKRIFVNGLIVKPSCIIHEDDVVDLNIPMEYGEIMSKEPEQVYFNIVYNDPDLAVINKPAGLVVHPAHGHYNHTLLNGLLYLFPELKKNTNLYRMGMVHRLDKDTSGLLIVTKNEVTQNFITMQFKNRTIEKEYAAVVNGRLEQERGEICTRIGRNPLDRKRMAVLITDGKESVTRYEVIEYLKNATYVKLIPHTGRMHQLRVHMSYIHHPVAGDNMYSRKRTNFHGLGLMLHARRIKFMHPRNGCMMEFKSELPDRFQIILQKGEI